MTQNELMDLLNEHEWRDVEFKEAQRKVPRNAYETVSAFANTEGGHLVFGVRKSGHEMEIVGVLDVDKVQSDFLTALRQSDKISVIVNVQEELHKHDDAVLLIFYVPEVHRSHKPVFLNGDIRRSFVRSGGSDVRCSDSERNRFLLDAAVERHDGRIVDFEEILDGAAVRIPLAGEVDVGGIADVTLWFSATLPTQVAAGTAGAGLYGFVDGVYDLAGFYPTLAVYDHEGWNLETAAGFGDSLFADIGFYQVELTVPQGLSIVASGSTLSQRTNDDGTTTWSIAAGPVRSFYAAVTGRWQAISEDVDGVLVNAFYPGGGLSSAQTAMDFTPKTLRVFNRLFGPYPYRELDVVPMPTTAFGMEYAGLFALAGGFYTEAGGAFAIAAPHEVAHQWFFNLVGNDQPDEPWLDESLANYAVYLYYEAVDWPQMQNAMLENIFRYRYNAARNLGIDRPVSGAVVEFDQSNYINIIYSKGPLFFHAVRERIGDGAFFAALRDYALRHRYGIAYADDLFAAFHRHSDTPIDDLIAFWIYGE